MLAALLIAASMGSQTPFIERLVSALRPADFFREWHRSLFQAFVDRWNAGEPCGLASLCQAQASARESADVVGLIQTAPWATGARNSPGPDLFMVAAASSATVRSCARRREAASRVSRGEPMPPAYTEVPE